MNDISPGNWLDAPKKCPKIGIQPDASVVERLVLNCEPFYVGSFNIGSEFTACDYYNPEGNLVQISRGVTRGPVSFQGYQCVEIDQVDYSPSGEPLSRIRRLLKVNSRFTHMLLSNLKRMDGSGVLEYTDLATPRTIETKFKWQVFEWEESRAESQTGFTQRIDGPYILHIGKTAIKCLRWLRTHIGPTVAFEEAEEIYVSVETGLTVLVRHFAGKGWPGLDDYSRCLKSEFDGHIFYLLWVRRVFRGEELG